MSTFKEESKKVLKEAEKLNKRLAKQAQDNHDFWLMYEDLQERHEIEKDKERKDHNEKIKHWKQTCRNLTIALVITVLLSGFGFMYMFHNYDFCDFDQSTSDGGNNIAGNNCNEVTFDGNTKN